MTPPALATEHLTKTYGGVAAVDELDFEVEPGRLVGIIGPNGAGKTTLLNLVSGVLRPTRGRVVVGGTDVTGWRADRMVTRARVVRTFQTVRLFSSMTVQDHVAVTEGVRARSRRARAAAEAVLERVGLSEHRRHLAAELSYGLQRRVELARALATDPAILLLDEPAAGLNATERAELGELLSTLAGSGLSIVLIEHHLDLVRAVSQDLLVMDFGRKVLFGPVTEALADPRVAEIYTGIKEPR
ncbi:MAG: ABC transporter ATP-binding protein [Acidimicrobiales bacterium]